MSGGVDSSVAAALCVAAGYRVVGIMLRLWAEPGAGGENRCCTLGAVDDARAVANALDIPFSVLDIRTTFRQVVIDRFLADAAAGDTPNPCFTCNRRVRFGLLLEQARALGADVLATGHYARVCRAPVGDGLSLWRGVDPDKDQSYMLHRLDQAQLAGALFPVGGYTKPEVRALAEHFGLPVASRADSVDLCWVGSGGVSGFLDRHLPPDVAAPGPIVDRAGRQLGQHRGLPYYTLGQRRGLGVAVGEPVYVLERDQARNRLVVGPVEALGARCVAIREMHWIAGRPPGGPLGVTAQVRYRAPAVPAVVVPGERKRATVVFDTPVRAPARGQGLVVYDGARCLGGGPIARDE